MKLPEACLSCMYRKQQERSDDPGFLSEVRTIIDTRDGRATAPYLSYLFNQAYERRFGRIESFAEIKKRYNELALSMEDRLREEIRNAEDPLLQALLYARIGNYIDFSAVRDVSEEAFLSLFQSAHLREEERETIDSFFRQCSTAKSFLLIADNCGEIVLDRLFLEELHRIYPELSLGVVVRGGEISNDATREDARDVGLDKVAKIYDNGLPAAGIVYDMLPEETRAAIEEADVILAKGQANYETMSGEGRHAFYSLLCKCDLFIEHFQVPRFTGLFLEESNHAYL